MEGKWVGVDVSRWEWVEVDGSGWDFDLVQSTMK